MMRSGYETGYELNPIQRIAANAASSRWRDAVVIAVGADGWLELADLAGDSVDRVWHYAPIAVAVGEPVSLHEQYSVLAIGRAQYSVRAA